MEHPPFHVLHRQLIPCFLFMFCITNRCLIYPTARIYYPVLFWISFMAATSFHFAATPLVLRASEKDAVYANVLAEQVLSTCTSVLGPRITNHYDTLLHTLGQALYPTLSLLGMFGSRATLGMEYAQILPVTASMRPLTDRRRVLFVVVLILMPLALKRLVRKLVPNRPASEVLRHIYKVHEAIFFLDGKYRTLTHRATQTRMLAMVAEQSGVTRAATSLYPRLGALSLAGSCLQLVVWLHQRYRSSRLRRRLGLSDADGGVAAPMTALYGNERYVTDDEGESDSTRGSSDEEENGSDQNRAGADGKLHRSRCRTGKCMLCHRRP